MRDVETRFSRVDVEPRLVVVILPSARTTCFRILVYNLPYCKEITKIACHDFLAIGLSLLVLLPLYICTWSF